jgi:hypothetical protein
MTVFDWLVFGSYITLCLVVMWLALHGSVVRGRK